LRGDLEKVRIDRPVYAEDAFRAGGTLLPLAIMAVFAARSTRSSRFGAFIKKYPGVFGVPFILIMVGASYGMSTITQTRYDLHDQKVKNVRHMYYLATIAEPSAGDERARAQAGPQPEKV